MITMRVVVTGDFRRLYKIRGKYSMEVLRGIMQEAAEYAEPRLKEEFGRLLPPPRTRGSSPIQWTSPAQKRAFFATGGFGRGIPTMRTGYVMNAFTVRRQDFERGQLLLVVNEAEYASFVLGDPRKPHWQQKFHRDWGWPDVRTLQNTFSTVADEVFTLVVSRIKQLKK